MWYCGFGDRELRVKQTSLESLLNEVFTQRVHLKSSSEAPSSLFLPVPQHRHSANPLLRKSQEEMAQSRLKQIQSLNSMCSKMECHRPILGSIKQTSQHYSLPRPGRHSALNMQLHPRHTDTSGVHAGIRFHPTSMHTDHSDHHWGEPHQETVGSFPP